MSLILVDMSNVALHALQSASSGKMNYFQLTEMSLRHVVLKRLFDIHKQFGIEREMVLCFDNENYWRSDVFPLYKATRAKARSYSKFSFEEYKKMFKVFKEELPYNFSWKCVDVEKCEADDVIYAICHHVRDRRITIVSSDEDYLQIQNINPIVEQFSIANDKFITPQNKGYDLLEHIITGDSGDGIPNILSNSNTFVMDGVRQTPMTKQRKADTLLSVQMGTLDENVQMRYDLNKKLIDMSELPKEYYDKIIEKFKEPKPKKTGSLMTYCIKYKLNNLLGRL